MRKLTMAAVLTLIGLAGLYTGSVVAQTMTIAPTPTTGVDLLDTGDEADGAVDVGQNAADADDVPKGAPRTGLGSEAR